MESKFNFSDDENVNVDSNNKQIQTNGWLKNTYFFFKVILDFKAQTDRDSTVNSIKEDISIKGATAWILICSIFVASVGLNANSIPVVIGAMLISPLMGPILGFGMSIAINDIETLKKSLINFIVMVSLSILTAYLFFAFLVSFCNNNKHDIFSWGRGAAGATRRAWRGGRKPNSSERLSLFKTCVLGASRRLGASF